MQQYRPWRQLWAVNLLAIVLTFLAAESAFAKVLSEIGSLNPARVAIFIGTFDPLHRNHERIIEAILNEGHAESVIVVPQNFNFFGYKPYKPNSLPIEHRIEMLKIRFAENKNIFVPELEHAKGFSISANVFAWLKIHLPQALLIGVYGDDRTGLSFRLIDRFFTPTAETLIHPRNNSADLIEESFMGKKISLVGPHPNEALSSSQLRQTLKSPDTSRAELSEKINSKILDYIYFHGLYSTRPTRFSCEILYRTYSQAQR